MKNCSKRGCRMAGTHGDPRFPTVLFCMEHMDPATDTFLIREDIPERAQPAEKPEFLENDE